ncbi:amino acid permease [Psychroflexus sp. MBR-150]|jgi:amino acid permease
MLKQVCFRFESFLSVSSSSEVENHQPTSRLRSMLKQVCFRFELFFLFQVGVLSFCFKLELFIVLGSSCFFCFKFELFIVSSSSEVENHQPTSRLRSMLKQVCFRFELFFLFQVGVLSFCFKLELFIVSSWCFIFLFQVRAIFLFQVRAFHCFKFERSREPPTHISTTLDVKTGGKG